MKYRTFFSAVALFSCILFCSFVIPQKESKTQKQDTANLKYQKSHQAYQRYLDSLDIEFRKLPPHMRKLEGALRDLLKEMKVAGITKENVITQNVHKRFSKNHMYVDSLGRIQVGITFKTIERTLFDKLISSNSRILGVVYTFNREHDQAFIKELKIRRISVDGFRTGRNYLEAYVPFESIEEIAKLPTVRLIKVQFIMNSNVGQVTTKGDTIHLAEKARDHFYLDGSGIKVGVISRGISNWQVDTTSNDLPRMFTYLANTNPVNPPGNEGTAICEIVHDIAPGSSIIYSDAGTGMIPMRGNIDSLKN